MPAAKKADRQVARFDDVFQHGPKALRILNLKLHMVHLFKHGKMPLRIRPHDRIAVFEMVFNAAKFEEAARLQNLRQHREGFVLQAVRQLAAQIAVGQRLSRRDEIRLNRVVVAPHDLFEGFSLRPIQALDRQIQKRRHHAPRSPANLGELPGRQKRRVPREAASRPETLPPGPRRWKKRRPAPAFPRLFCAETSLPAAPRPLYSRISAPRSRRWTSAGYRNTAPANFSQRVRCSPR